MGPTISQPGSDHETPADIVRHNEDFNRLPHKVQPHLSILINFILFNFRERMRPDYAFKLFVDQRSRYIFLLVSLATAS